MKVMILRNTFVSGVIKLKGKEYELAEKDAKLLIGMKKAEQVKPPVPEPKPKKGK